MKIARVAALALVAMSAISQAQDRPRIVSSKGVFEEHFACYREMSKLIGSYWDKSIHEVGAIIVPRATGKGFYLMTPNAAHYYAFDPKIAVGGSYHYEIKLDGKPITYVTYGRANGDPGRPMLSISSKAEAGVSTDKIQVLREANALDEVAYTAFASALTQRLRELAKPENQTNKKAVDAALDVCAKVDNQGVKAEIVRTKMALEGVPRTSAVGDSGSNSNSGTAD